MGEFNEGALIDSSRLPWVIHGRSGDRLATFIEAHRDYVQTRLLDHGAVLFRGFATGSAEAFSAVGSALGVDGLDYRYRSTPRTEVGGGVMTSTEYPPAEAIPLHSENSYQAAWPRLVAFWSRIPAETGGETPIADLKQVTARLDPDLLARFETRGVRYVRHYRPYLDLPWQTVFQTRDPEAVEAYCAREGIACTWLKGGVLRTEQVCQGVARHPVTGERVFFNQAHLFHPSSLDPEVERMLTASYGDALPRHATYGDGTEIPRSDLAAIRAAYDDAAIAFPWRADDVLLLDNMQTAHGRRPYQGERALLALLLDLYRPPVSETGRRFAASQLTGGVV